MPSRTSVECGAWMHAWSPYKRKAKGDEQLSTYPGNGRSLPDRLIFTFELDASHGSIAI
jgi:hypothetical protein